MKGKIVTNKISKIVSSLFLTFVFLCTPFARATQLECETVYMLMKSLLSQHLKFKKLTPELEDRTINQYVKTLDPSKLYFLNADTNKIKADSKGLFTQIGSGKCNQIEAIQELYKKRIKDSEVFAKKVLGPAF